MNGSGKDSPGSKRDPLVELRQLVREGLEDDRPSSVNISIEQVQQEKRAASLQPKASASAKEAAIGTIVLAALSWLGRKVWMLFHHGP